jgi:hypothetical protein
MTFSLVRMTKKCYDIIDLEDMSTKLSLLEMNQIAIILEVTVSRTKRKSILMCLVHARDDGFAIKYVAQMLLDHKVRGVGRKIPRLRSMD